MHAPSRRTAAALAALLLGSVTLTACGSDDTTDDAQAAPLASTSIELGPTETETPSTTTKATPAADVELAVSITGTKVEPAPGVLKVDKGDTVALTITRDTTGEIHVHGYEVDTVAKAGKPTTVEFVADQTGVFEVETHDPDRLLTRLQVS